jgi:outer membrane protein assembly factor BamB
MKTLPSASGLLPALALVAVSAASAAWARAADWPQWLGPGRDGRSAETGLLTEWPAAGPKVLWRVPGGVGMSGVAVAGGRAFTMAMRGDDELAVALDAADGREVWAVRVGPAFRERQGDGPRATPTVDGGHVFVQSASGPLACLDAATGKTVWTRDLIAEFGAENAPWGMCGSPLIEGGLVIACPGAKGASVAALDKATGKTVRRAGDDKAGYASPVAMAVGGARQIVAFSAGSLNGFDAATGKVAWGLPWKTDFDCNIATPLVLGERLFVASGEGVGCRMLEPAAAGGPKAVWESLGPKSVMLTHWSTAVAHEGRLYGVSGEFNGVVNLNCVDAATGRLQWSQPRFGAAGIALADGHLFLATRTGELVCVEASPAGFKEKGRVRLLQDKVYANPSIAGGRLYLRDRKDIVCVDLSAAK